MPIRLGDHGVLIMCKETVFGDIAFPKFSELVGRHLQSYPRTPEIEATAIQVVSSDFDEQPLKSYIHDVCVWGGHPGIAARVINQNPIATIQDCFRRAYGKLAKDNPNVEDVLRDVNHIQNLGTPSFASKHLRFLKPEVCPILDKWISFYADYDFNPKGYRSLSDDCLRIAIALQERKIDNPMARHGNKWYAADVEMAVFADLTNL